MQDTPRANRLHIAIFGVRNAGKSSLINALTNQDIALVSDTPGTTTDPVFKAMEILPLGPVMLIDTAGIDDEGSLGELRTARTWKVLDQADLVLLVMDNAHLDSGYEQEVLQRCRERNIPVVGVLNKVDLLIKDIEKELQTLGAALDIPLAAVSTVRKEGLEDLIQLVIAHAPQDWAEPALAGDLVRKGDLVVLVTPIDASAPKGRLILPQVQSIRDLLDHDNWIVVVKETELEELLAKVTPKPRLVITDSQVFPLVNRLTPMEITLTSFSILFARYKGDLATLVRGALAIADLRPGDKVLIAEGCTHHRTDDDIGKVKIPRWLQERVGGALDFTWASGSSLPPELESFRLIVHCGACMLNRREMLSRLMTAQRAAVPIVNYGVCIAYLHGILPRVLSPFPDVLKLLPNSSESQEAGNETSV